MRVSIRGVIDRLEEGFMALALASMTLLTFIQVVLREFGTGWVWSLEATTYTFAWMVLVGMSYGVRTKSHIAVDLAVRKLPSGLRRLFTLAAVALCLVYCGFMFYGGSIFVEGLLILGNDARDIPLPRWLLTGIMPVGFVLLAYRFLQVGRAIYMGTETGLTAQHGRADSTHLDEGTQLDKDAHLDVGTHPDEGVHLDKGAHPDEGAHVNKGTP